MSDDELTVHYRGYLLIQRHAPRTGCDRVYDADGTAHPITPTLNEGYFNWVVARPAADGGLEELDAAPTYEEARRIADDLACRSGCQT